MFHGCRDKQSQQAHGAVNFEGEAGFGCCEFSRLNDANGRVIQSDEVSRL